jgi:phytol kinase
MGLGGDAEEMVETKDVDIAAVANGESTTVGDRPDGSKDQPDVESGPALCGCGFPPDSREDLTTPWPVQEKLCFIIPAFVGLVAIVGSIVHAAAPDDLPWMAPQPLEDFILGVVAGTIGVNVAFGFIGFFVIRFGMPVAVSRKILHLLLVGIVPLLTVHSTEAEGGNSSVGSMGQELNRSNTIAAEVWGVAVWSNLAVQISNLSMLKPIRRLPYIGVLPRTAFAAFDRPEDRPWTLLWQMTQIVAILAVETPMIYWTIAKDAGLLRYLAPLAVGLGDGLAEPIGKRFGKHKYSAYALFTRKKFTRSYEGSANVYFWTLMGVLVAIPQLNIAQVLFLAILLPPAVTLAESFSPHGWDNPFMFGTIWIFLAAAVEINM